MAAGKSRFDDVTFDLLSVQYHSLKAGHDYGQYVRDAKTAGLDDIASFFEEVTAQDLDRAHKCHNFLERSPRIPSHLASAAALPGQHRRLRRVKF
jgi:hypothetical protein